MDNYALRTLFSVWFCAGDKIYNKILYRCWYSCDSTDGIIRFSVVSGLEDAGSKSDMGLDKKYKFILKARIPRPDGGGVFVSIELDASPV